MNFKIDGEYTIFSINSMLGMTSKSEVKVKQLKDNGDPIFVSKGKRTRYAFNDDWRTTKLVFEGWNLPLKADTDQTGSYTMVGNACFNLLGTVEFVKDYIEKNNLNEYFNRFDSILAYPTAPNGNTDGIPVFPETPTTHAVILRIREKLGISNKAPEVVYGYSREEAKEDGVLMDNPKKENFSECDIITTNLWDKLEEFADKRNHQRIEPIDASYLLGCLMLAAKDQYTSKRFIGDNDKDFFVAPTPEDAPDFKVWFVRNENGMLTAMLPDDY